MFYQLPPKPDNDYNSNPLELKSPLKSVFGLMVRIMIIDFD